MYSHGTAGPLEEITEEEQHLPFVGQPTPDLEPATHHYPGLHEHDHQEEAFYVGGPSLLNDRKGANLTFKETVGGCHTCTHANCSGQVHSFFSQQKDFDNCPSMQSFKRSLGPFGCGGKVDMK